MRKWPTIRVADEFDLQMGKTPARDNPAYWGGDQKWASIADIGRSGMYLSDTKETITQAAVSETGIKAIPSNTVVMSFKLSIGRTAITASKMYSNEAIMAFLPCDKSAFDLHFLYHLFSNRNWSEGCNKAVKGVTLNKATLNAARIPKPDILEQRAVALTLDHICNLIAKCDEQIVRLDKLVKSRFVEMFGDMPNSTKMAEVCSLITDGTHQSPKFVESGIPFLFVSNVVSNRLTYDAEKFIDEATYEELIKRTPIEIGDVLLSTVGSYGHPAIVNSDRRFLFQRHIAYLKPRKEIVDSQFLHGAILSASVQEQIERKVKGIAQKTLNLSEIKTIMVTLPPLVLQREFAAFVAKVDKLAFAARRRRDVAKQLYRAKIQEYFG